MGLDGADWVLEGLKDTRYHCWNLWCPTEDGRQGAFRDLCLYLFELSGLESEGIHVS